MKTLRAAMLGAVTIVCPVVSHATTGSVTRDHARGYHNAALPDIAPPGATVVLRYDAAAAEPAQLQWLHDDRPIANATEATLVLTNVSAGDTGNYRVQVTSKDGTDYSPTAVLNVLPLPPSPVDRTFTSNVTGANLDTARFFADGSFAVEVAKASGKVDLIRVRADGARDETFRVYSGAPGSLLAVYPDRRVVIAAPPYLVEADGSSSSLALPPGFDAAQPLTAAAVQSDGKLLIAQGNRLARLKSDGTPDSGFVFSYSGTLSDSKPISQLQLDAAGRIYVSGFDRVPDSLWPSWPSIPPSPIYDWSVIFRLRPSGAEDTGFVHLRNVQFKDDVLRITPLASGVSLFEDHNDPNTSWYIVDDAGRSSGFAAWSWFLGLPSAHSAIDPTSERLFLIDHDHAIGRTSLNTGQLVVDPSFYPGSGVADTMAVAPDGKLLVSGDFTAWDGHPTVGLARLRTDQVMSTPAHVVAYASISPVPAPLRQGSTVEFGAEIIGTAPLSYEWIALDGQLLPPDRFGEQLTLPSVTPRQLGRYQLRVAGPGGLVLSNVVALELDPISPPYLANLSGRAKTGRDENMVIGGLVTLGSSNPYWNPAGLLRGVGPGLRSLGVTGAIPNPAIDLFDQNGALLGNNDQWENGDRQIASMAKSLGAFPLAAGSFDASVLHQFSAGRYTLMLKDQGQGDGVGLLEIYGVPNLVNLSFRARTAPGEETAIAGFVITDPLAFGRGLRVLLRAVGPTLGTQGITHPLANPVLNVFNAKGERVASNDDWASDNSSGDSAALTAAMQQVGAFHLPASSKDAALLLDLPPGAYTMHAQGGEGVVLLEIYLVR